MNTIASHQALATLGARLHVIYAHPLAATEMAGGGPAAARMTLAVVILTLAALAAMKSAVGTLSHLMAELLRALAAITFTMIILVIVTGVLYAFLLAHH